MHGPNIVDGIYRCGLWAKTESGFGTEKLHAVTQRFWMQDGAVCELPAARELETEEMADDGVTVVTFEGGEEEEQQDEYEAEGEDGGGGEEEASEEDEEYMDDEEDEEYMDDEDEHEKDEEAGAEQESEEKAGLRDVLLPALRVLEWDEDSEAPPVKMASGYRLLLNPASATGYKHVGILHSKTKSSKAKKYSARVRHSILHLSSWPTSSSHPPQTSLRTAPHPSPPTPRHTYVISSHAHTLPLRPPPIYPHRSPTAGASPTSACSNHPSRRPSPSPST